MITAVIPEPLHALPGEARIWTYVTDRDLNELEEKRVIEILAEFCSAWVSHGVPVESAAGIVEGRFVMIAGHIPDQGISGCGIDASVHALERARTELGFEWLPALFVHYRDHAGVIRSVTRAEFRARVRDGAVHAGTPVFDPGVRFLGDLREGLFEQLAHATWHGRAFGIVQDAPESPAVRP